MSLDPHLKLTLAVLAPLLAAALCLALPRRLIGLRVLIAVAGPAATMGLMIHYVTSLDGGVTANPLLLTWMPSLKLDLAWNADQLGLFFALLVSSIGVLICLYARAYFGPKADDLYRFYPSLLLFMTAMLGVALADGFMLLLLFWELTSISSFLLIGWERDDPSAVKKAMQAFIVTGAGGLVMMGGLILLGIVSGHWTFSAVRAAVEHQELTGSTLLTASFVMIFAGAAAKSAQWPLHFWLPGAMAAPTPVSAYLHSATMVKAGVYLVGRLWPILAIAVPLWPQLIVPLGAITMVYAAFIALQKTDLKQIFAYTTVSQLGLLMCMYGLAAVPFSHDGATHPNLLWDVSQILNHALYKAPLFILAGAIGHVASRQLPELRGFFHTGGTHRIMAVLLLLAGYALAAGPLTISFTAKEFFFYQIWHGYKATHSPWFYVLIAAGIATGMFNVAIFIRLARTLLAQPETHADSSHHGDPHHPDHETGSWPAFLWIPGAVILAFQFVGGIVPGAYEAMFGWLDPSTGNYDFHASTGAFPMTWEAHLGVPLFMSLAAIVLGVLLAFAPLLRKVFDDPHDRTYPLFYALCTRGGGRVFTLMQTGNTRTYVAFIFAAVVVIFLAAVRWDVTTLTTWPDGAHLESDLTGYLVITIVCLTAILMPFVSSTASRVLVLGACGFSVTALYYAYRAPDLALTQISIEIVSLILFLLVLSLLPGDSRADHRLAVPRIALAVAVGGIMFWLTLHSSLGRRPTMPYLDHAGKPLAHLGDFFLRNSNHAHDTQAWDQTSGDGVVHRGPGEDGRGIMLHHGGGGNNVVNVILVDGRGFDTLGEITVLALAALGVWTLIRRPRRDAKIGDNCGGSGDPEEETPNHMPATGRLPT